MNKFNFDNKLKNIARKTIFCGDEQYNNLITKYNEKFEFSQKKFQEIFENKFTDSFERIKKNI